MCTLMVIQEAGMIIIIYTNAPNVGVSYQLQKIESKELEGNDGNQMG